MPGLYDIGFSVCDVHYCNAFVLLKSCQASKPLESSIVHRVCSCIWHFCSLVLCQFDKLCAIGLCFMLHVALKINMNFVVSMFGS